MLALALVGVVSACGKAQSAAWPTLDGDLGFIVRAKPLATLAGPFPLEDGKLIAPIQLPEGQRLIAVAVDTTRYLGSKVPIDPERLLESALSFEGEACGEGHVLGDERVRVPLTSAAVASLEPGAAEFRPAEISVLGEVALTYRARIGECGPELDVRPFGASERLLPSGIVLSGQARTGPHTLSIEDLGVMGERVLAVTRRMILVFEPGQPALDDDQHVLIGPELRSYRDIAVAPDGSFAVVSQDRSGDTLESALIEVRLDERGLETVRTATTLPGVDVNDIAIDRLGQIIAVGVDSAGSGVVIWSESLEGPYRSRVVGPDRLLRVVAPARVGPLHVAADGRGGLFEGDLRGAESAIVLESRELPALAAGTESVWVAGHEGLSWHSGQLPFATTLWPSTAVAAAFVGCASGFDRCGVRSLAGAPVDLAEVTQSSVLVSLERCSSLALVRVPDGCTGHVSPLALPAGRGDDFWHLQRDGQRIFVGGTEGRLYVLEP
ncbi:MAG: hypothetical protein HYV07_31550 [Deltaproteobacteria bacterium]|nr:hypothetical protein [Deltaproteobacteria bacterium]